MTATYKSTRLLIEAVNHEMLAVRKAALGNMEAGALNELRDLVDQLIKKADRTAVEDVRELAPADYVATMKPLVADYHRLLLARDLLETCLCMDLRANACVVILVGDEGSRARAAHDPGRPDAALIVETLLASLDDGVKRIAAEAAAVKQRAEVGLVGIDQELSTQRLEAVPVFAGSPEDSSPNDPLDDMTREPCSSFPDGVEAKSVSLTCPRCGTWRCWRRYLSWEKALGIALNQELHPAEVDEDHKGLRFGPGPEMGDEDGQG